MSENKRPRKEITMPKLITSLGLAAVGILVVYGWVNSLTPEQSTLLIGAMCGIPTVVMSAIFIKNIRKEKKKFEPENRAFKKSDRIMKHAIKTKEKAQARVKDIVRRLAEIEYNRNVLNKKRKDEWDWETHLNHLQKITNEEFEAKRLESELNDLRGVDGQFDGLITAARKAARKELNKRAEYPVSLEERIRK